jgi:hypothetical protein
MYFVFSYSKSTHVIVDNRHTSSSIIERISGANFEKADGKSDFPEGDGTVPCQSSFRAWVRTRVNLVTYFTRRCGMSEDLPMIALRRGDLALLPIPTHFIE